MGNSDSRPSSAYSLVALPIGRDVPRVAYRQAVDVRGITELVDDLKTGGLLTLDSRRIDAVDQRHRIGLREFAGEHQAVIKLPLTCSNTAPCTNACASFPMAILPAGTSTAQIMPARTA